MQTSEVRGRFAICSRPNLEKWIVRKMYGNVPFTTFMLSDLDADTQNLEKKGAHWHKTRVQGRKITEGQAALFQLDEGRDARGWRRSYSSSARARLRQGLAALL